MSKNSGNFLTAPLTLSLFLNNSHDMKTFGYWRHISLYSYSTGEGQLNGPASSALSEGNPLALDKRLDGR
jgi:hypothetical protein